MRSLLTGQPEHHISRRQFLKAGAALAAAGLTAPWLAGCGGGEPSQDATGTWKAMTWEGKDEMKKWNLHLGNFFKKNYPKMKWEVDFGLTWEEYWTKLQTTIAGGAPARYVLDA